MFITLLTTIDCFIELNPLVTNGLSHLYHFDESTSIYRGIRSNFSFLFHFSMKFLYADRKVPDGMLRFAASHLWLFCLPISHKKNARLIWVNNVSSKIHFPAFEQSLVMWVPDSEVKSCPFCGRSFGMTRRRHHCRLCGGIMCDRCSHFLTHAYASE